MESYDFNVPTGLISVMQVHSCSREPAWAVIGKLIAASFYGYPGSVRQIVSQHAVRHRRKRRQPTTQTVDTNQPGRSENRPPKLWKTFKKKKKGTH